MKHVWLPDRVSQSNLKKKSVSDFCVHTRNVNENQICTGLMQYIDRCPFSLVTCRILLEMHLYRLPNIIRLFHKMPTKYIYWCQYWKLLNKVVFTVHISNHVCCHVTYSADNRLTKLANHFTILQKMFCSFDLVIL